MTQKFVTHEEAMEFVATLDWDDFVYFGERAAIREYDGRMWKKNAEIAAANDVKDEITRRSLKGEQQQHEKGCN